MKPSVCAIGLDVGGTKTAGGLVAPDGTILVRRSIPTLSQRGGEAVLQDALSFAASLHDEAMAAGRSVLAVGIGICELVDLHGNVASAQTIAWRGVPVQERFARLAPAFVEADARAAAFCEARFGAGRNHRIFLYLTIGTGIGSSLVLDGVPYAGARGSSGTLASSPLTTICPECGAELRPVPEQIASGPGLVTHYNQLSAKRAEKAEDVLAAATTGDHDAAHVVRTAGEALGATVGLMVNMLDPEAVVVGGGLGMAGGLYWASLVASTRRHIWSDTHRDLPIETAAHGRDAGFVGAAALALQRSAALS